MTRVYKSNGLQAWWGGVGVLVGAAVSSYQHSLGTGALVALIAIPVVVVNRWMFRRWAKVELTATEVTGPSRHSLFKRKTIPLSRIDRERTGKRSFLAKWYGRWDLFTETGECVRVPCVLLGPAMTEELMRELGFVSDEAKWARRRNEFGWFIVAAWALSAFLIMKSSS